jgi:DNA-binding transcriptional regulator YhcF (GntR family)
MAKIRIETTKTQRQVSQRWTPELAEEWTPVSDVFLRHYIELNMTTAEAMFIILLMSHKWGKEAPYPSFKSLAKRMGVTMTTARGYGRHLEQLGLIHRELRVDDTNIFHLDHLFTLLENKKKEDDAKKAANAKRRIAIERAMQADYS